MDSYIIVAIIAFIAGVAWALAYSVSEFDDGPLDFDEEFL